LNDKYKNTSFLAELWKGIIKISKIGTNVLFIVTPLFMNHPNFANIKT